MDALQWSQLASMLAQTTDLFAPPQSQQARMGQALTQGAQSNIVSERLRKEKEAQKKREKSAFGGSIGGVLGTAAGLGLASLTGGGSLAMAGLGAAGGATGSAAGSALAGGSPSMQQMAMSGVQGGVSGYAMGQQQAAIQPTAGEQLQPMPQLGSQVGVGGTSQPVPPLVPGGGGGAATAMSQPTAGGALRSFGNAGLAAMPQLGGNIALGGGPNDQQWRNPGQRDRFVPPRQQPTQQQYQQATGRETVPVDSFGRPISPQQTRPGLAETRQQAEARAAMPTPTQTGPIRQGMRNAMGYLQQQFGTREPVYDANGNVVAWRYR